MFSGLCSVELKCNSNKDNDFSFYTLVPRPSHRPVFVLLQSMHTASYQKRGPESLGTRLGSQTPPKGSVATGESIFPLVVGVAREQIYMH